MQNLTVELIPATMWGANLRAILPTPVWDRLRRACYKAADNKCEVCNKTGWNRRVECHERWEFDELNGVQILAGVVSLCPTCHQAKHIGRLLATSNDQQIGRVVMKLMEVNGWTEQQVSAHIEEAFAQFNKRSQRKWTLDITWLDANMEMWQ